MFKRTVGIYCVVVILMTCLIFRIYFINASGYLTMAVANQGSYSVAVATTRGVIYDRNMQSLVNNEFEYIASVMPTPQSAAEILKAVPQEQSEAVMQKLGEMLPFALKVPTNAIYSQGVDVFRVPKRYGGYQYAPHIIGYLGGDGVTGVAGIELCYDEELKNTGGKIKCSYKLDAAGHAMPGAVMQLDRQNEDPKGGVCLTLDKEIQQIAEKSLKSGCEKGAAIVTEIETGNILAMASIPVFDQNDIAASLDSNAAPFISRAVSGYNIGSVYKLIASAAALEKGISQYREHVCQGYVDVGGVIFRCNNDVVHGPCDMQKALQVSCNAYFITLAEEMGAEYLLSFSENMGFGRPTVLAPGMTTQPGNLPAPAELKNPAALANMGFGQGSSLATPLQMTYAVAALVNDGNYILPKLVRGTTEDGINLNTVTPVFAPSRVVSENTSVIIRKLMAGVVNDGSGKTAMPKKSGAGGKTSSAQTGIFVDGEEIVHAWFAGYFPEDKPKYMITVFVENGQSGEHAAAPVFKKIADELYIIE